MPFGRKPDASGLTVDFDAVYRHLIAPAIEEAGLESLRADEEMTGGIIHKPMFERLILCEFAVADLTTANANVFYELGIRHAVRPNSTMLLFAENTRLPFDLALLRGLPYYLNAAGAPERVTQTKAALVERFRHARRNPDNDSPLFQLVEKFPDVSSLKTDVFRDRVQYALDMKEKLAEARRQSLDAVRQCEQHMQPIADQDSGAVIDLYLSYRACKGWAEMIALVPKMAPPLAATVLVQEQLALAFNRAGHGERAERVLLDVLERRGPSSETLGILGRVYKDRWEAALKEDQPALARGLLDKAIATYLRGFETDWRDAYPGVNAVTLMELRDPPDQRRCRLLPIVAYAVERRIARGKPDYWDFATRLELAILAQDADCASVALADALAAVRESWEPESTARNLRLIREARAQRGENQPWAEKIEQTLLRRARQ